MYFTKRQAGVVYPGSWMDPHLCVHGASVQLQEFPSPPRVLAGRRKEVHPLQGCPCGTETEEYSRGSNSRYTAIPLKDSREPPTEDADVCYLLTCGGFLYEEVWKTFLD